ncbi:hypothetical protein CY34DRAFT_811859 [Suillus luteus UH-Slu-Lm8-n1]|uniref:Unplaced genomic scaffold CY34scaffold_454, whole genome shotgun sequence n=1 Tax=Suillus luteus UH-Slu-Lm8-n1 TaxID=930992 RepID=A0A0C9ZEC3_9AGAM|nr:hypothetical protein CY34DRAFT_811859 [Suillus luteus UH-Slu-Lm8-n1]
MNSLWVLTDNLKNRFKQRLLGYRYATHLHNVVFASPDARSLVDHQCCINLKTLKIIFSSLVNTSPLTTAV